MPDDRTYTALSRQLRGLGTESLELTVKTADRTNVRLVSPAGLLADLGGLKRLNAAGANLYIRGTRTADHDLILLDDLGRFTLDRMKAAGHAAAVAVETSPGSIQAWIRLGQPVAASTRHEIVRYLVGLYGGDPGAIDPHQSGRLAGFTNRKPQHRTTRGFPFVMLLSAAGKPCADAAELIRFGERAVASRPSITTVIPDLTASTDLVVWWRAGYAARPGVDLSDVDWSQTHQALASGYSPEAVAAALTEAADRKGKSATDYATRTVGKAVASRTPTPPHSPDF